MARSSAGTALSGAARAQFKPEPEPKARLVRRRRAGIEVRGGEFEPPVTLAVERQFGPDRPRRARERDAERAIAARSQRPVERRANVVALGQIGGAPVARRVCAASRRPRERTRRGSTRHAGGRSRLVLRLRRASRARRSGWSRAGDSGCPRRSTRRRPATARRVARRGRRPRIRRGSSEATNEAAASVNPPENTARRLSTARSCGASNS